MFEERRNEVAALGSEFQHASIGHHGGGWGHPIDRVCRPLLSVCLGRRKDLAQWGPPPWTELQWVTLRNVIELAEDS